MFGGGVCKHKSHYNPTVPASESPVKMEPIKALVVFAENCLFSPGQDQSELARIKSAPPRPVTVSQWSQLISRRADSDRVGLDFELWNDMRADREDDVTQTVARHGITWLDGLIQPHLTIQYWFPGVNQPEIFSFDKSLTVGWDTALSHSTL